MSILEILFGGRFVHVRTSSTCEWYEWKRTRETKWAKRIDAFFNPKS